MSMPECFLCNKAGYRASQCTSKGRLKAISEQGQPLKFFNVNDAKEKADVLFNNKCCVVVAPGVVEQILRQITPIAEYAREGRFYLAEMTMSELTSSFGRPGR